MSAEVTMGATLLCSFGVAPSTLVVIPHDQVLATTPAANIMDMAPMTNIPPFGMCQSLANPTVASATAAAFGALTPMPCIPVTAGPWAPGSPTVLIGEMPALTQDSKCMCAYGGVIQITVPGQVIAQPSG